MAICPNAVAPIADSLFHLPGNDNSHQQGIGPIYFIHYMVCPPGEPHGTHQWRNVARLEAL